MPTRRPFLHGLRDSAPFSLVIIPFGVLFGVVGTEAGLTLTEVMGFSILVIAGASQFTALQLMGEHAPTLIVLATALAVNLRMAMYSVALVPHLGAAPRWHRVLIAYFLVDQTFAASSLAFDRAPEMTLAQKTAYFFGAVLAVCPLWVVATFAGATLGAAIPPEYALDFALPLTFLAMTAPLLRSPAHLAAAGVSVVLALACAGLPSGTGVLVAALGAMLTGAEVERQMTRRRPA